MNWWALLAVVAMMIWTVAALGAMDMLPASTIWRWQTWRTWLRNPKNAAQALRVGTWVFAIVFAGVTWLSLPWSKLSVELAEFRTEATGLAIVVLVIEEVSRLRQKLEYKQGIIEQMASRSNDFALDAARIAVDNEWHKDGSLQGAVLWDANLKDADLGGANLQGSYLAGANLRSAFLAFVNLKGANLLDTVLWRASLEGADLEDACLENAQLWDANVQGANLRGANLQGADLGSARVQGDYLLPANFRDTVYDYHTQWPNDKPPSGTLNWDEMSKQEHVAWRERRKERRERAKIAGIRK